MTQSKLTVEKLEKFLKEVLGTPYSGPALAWEHDQQTFCLYTWGTPESPSQTWRRDVCFGYTLEDLVKDYYDVKAHEEREKQQQQKKAVKKNAKEKSRPDKRGTGKAVSTRVAKLAPATGKRKAGKTSR